MVRILCLCRCLPNMFKNIAFILRSVVRLSRMQQSTNRQPIYVVDSLILRSSHEVFLLFIYLLLRCTYRVCFIHFWSISFYPMRHSIWKRTRTNMTYVFVFFFLHEQEGQLRIVHWTEQTYIHFVRVFRINKIRFSIYYQEWITVQLKFKWINNVCKYLNDSICKIIRLNRKKEMSMR